MGGPVSADRERARITEVWRGNRSYLVDLAFRMLGDVGEAEDIVQEAFARLLRANVEKIEDERGWLIVVTSRLCLDHIRSARVRRQRPYDLASGEADVATLDATAIDPADRVTLDDGVRLALLVVLERLSPAERVAYVLHDIFQMPFDVIAETVGRPVPTCRQLARRARLKIEEDDGRTRLTVGPSEHVEVTERFIAACADGDLAGLLAVLDPDVSGTLDVRGDVVVRGSSNVARNLLRFWGGHGTLVSQPVGGRPAVLAFADRELAMVFVLTFDGKRITEIHGIADPAKVGFLRDQLGGRGN